MVFLGSVIPYHRNYSSVEFHTAWIFVWDKSEAFASHQCLCLIRYYNNFLKWDLTIDGEHGADHMFFFTLRDALNLGTGEHFGLIKDCSSNSCKLRDNIVDALLDSDVNAIWAPTSFWRAKFIWAESVLFVFEALFKPLLKPRWRWVIQVESGLNLMRPQAHVYWNLSVSWRSTIQNITKTSPKTF